MAAIRNVMLQFGMIQAAVSILKATEDRTKVSTNMTHNCGKGQLHPLNQKMICSGCGVEVPRNASTKAFQATKGVYIEVTDADMAAVRVPSTGLIAIQEIVRADVLADPLLVTGDAYFLVPPPKEKYPPVAYTIILKALGTDVAIARTEAYNREYTCAIRVGKNGLIMHYLRYPNELRAEPSIPLPTVDQSHVQMVKQLFDGIRTANPKLDYPDHYNEAFANMVAAKLAGQPLVAPTSAPAPVAQDNLKAMLEAMLAAQGGKPSAQDEANAAHDKAAQEQAVKTEEPAKKAKGKKGKAA
jgi:DNA end-binding protein Ku